MYKIIDIETQEVLREVADLPVSIASNEFVVQGETITSIGSAVNAVNIAAHTKILEGFTYTNGVKFSLSELDQLNYNSVATMVNMGAESIVLHGSLNDELYHEVTFTNAEASTFFVAIFAYVSGILSEYRDIKKLLLASPEEGIDQILQDASIVVG